MEINGKFEINGVELKYSDFNGFITIINSFVNLDFGGILILNEEKFNFKNAEEYNILIKEILKHSEEDIKIKEETEKFLSMVEKVSKIKDFLIKYLAYKKDKPYFLLKKENLADALIDFTGIKCLESLN